MLDGIVECLVERRKTKKAYLIRFLAFLIDSILIAASLFIFLYMTAFSAIIFIFAIIGVVLTWLAIRNTNIEYEYSFFEGEFTVDRILNKSNRKCVKKFSFDKLELIVPKGSHRLGGNPNNNRRKYNYSALDPELKDYVAVVIDDNASAVEVIFTPNTELLEILNKKYPRKVTINE